MGQFESATGRHSQKLGARQIYQEMKEQIAGGAFSSEGQLPSSRALALELGVSRTTVTAAYEQLLAEGFIRVHQGARPRVVVPVGDPVKRQPSQNHKSPRLSAFGERLRSIPAPADQTVTKLVADFRYGDLAQSDFPAAIWKRAVNAAMVRPTQRLQYEDPRGSKRLRMALQGYLWRARTIRCELDQIIIVNGSQQGLDLCARLMLDTSDTFVIENPCYAMARQVFVSTGASATCLPVDQEGMRTEMLENVRARLAYVTPSHQFPLGSVMSISRRRQLLKWARLQSAFVIEDDYDSEYRYDIKPVPPMHTLEDSPNVVYLGTISKTLSPTLRIGYLVVPHQLQEVFATAKRLTDRHSPVTEQDALASLIESGTYESHVRRVRRLNSERRETLLNALARTFGEKIVIEGADAGLHIVVWFKDLPLSAEASLIDNARRLSVGIYSASSLYATQELHPDRIGLVMGYASMEVRQIERGVQLLWQSAEHLW